MTPHGLPIQVQAREHASAKARKRFLNVVASLALSSLALAGLALPSAAIAAEPMLEKVDLFEAGVGGYSMYRIPGIVVTTKGTVLAYCEARKGSGKDWSEIEVLMRRSADGGQTWSEVRQVAHLGERVPKHPIVIARKMATEGTQTVNNPVAIVDRQTGAVHFLYCVEYMRCFYMRSDDDGLTFTQPVEITPTFEAFRSDYEANVIATGPGHGIQLASGRLVVPVWLSTAAGGNAHRPSVTSVVYSDDHGRTWRRGEIALPDTSEFIFPNETCAVELADGRVLLNARSESMPNRRLLTTSRDGATGWSEPKFHEQLLEPICMASMVRLTRAPEHDRNRLLFSNPNNLLSGDEPAQPGKKADRKNLSIKLSYDESQSWPVTKTIEPSTSGYSDLAVLDDGTILCLYERAGIGGSTNATQTGYLTLARFNLEWLTDGKDSIKTKK